MRSIRYIGGKAYLDDCVEISWISGELKANYDKRKISQEEAAALIDEYMKNVINNTEKRYSREVRKV